MHMVPRVVFRFPSVGVLLLSVAVSLPAFGVVPSPPTIAKVFGAAQVPLNGTTSLTVTLTNPNASPLTGLAFSDSFPVGLVFASPSALATTCGGVAVAASSPATLSLSGGSLAANATCTVSANVVGTTAGTKVNTTTAVTSAEGGTGGTATATLTVVAPPTISKAFGAAQIPLNGTTSLTVTLTNPNATTLTGISFTDSLPAGLGIASPSNLASTCGGVAVATTSPASLGSSGGTLAANATCTVSVNVTGTAPGQQTNVTGAVTSTNGGTGGTATASVTVVTPDLTVAKSHAGNLSIGQTGAVYTITVSNVGSGPTNGSTVTLVDTLPANLTATAMGGTGWTCTLATTTCTRTDVLNGGSSYPPITLTVNVAQATFGPNLINTATVSGGGDTNAANNTATDAAIVIGAIPTLSPLMLALFAMALVAFGAMRLIGRN